MKISDFECFVVANPPPHFGGQYFIFVKLTTNNGLIGYGEVYAATFSPHIIAAMIEDVVERYFIGADPFDIEKLWQMVYGSGYTARPDLSLVAVFSGLEIACWDIMGKAVNKPIHKLLGGKIRSQLRTYTYLYPDEDEDPENFYADPIRSAQRAAENVADGFTAVKFDPAGPYTIYDPHQPRLDDIDRSVQFVKSLRDAVGNQADLLFGTHGQFTTAGAIRLAEKIKPYDPLWFEEPVPAENAKEMARVARQTAIPIATGERLVTKYEFARLLEEQAASILQPALGRVGGILEAKKISAMAECHYAQLAPHLYCGPIEGAANIQFSASIPNFLIMESIGKWEGFYSSLLTKPISWQQGYIDVPSEPGLGVELDEAVARAHPYKGSKLHLEMEPKPIDLIGREEHI